jgi:hypothetical protein
MGDRVERALEETVPLLRTIRKLKLLTEEEVRTIVQKRRDHEYALRRPGAPRILFLRYAAFERELTELLKARAVDRNIPEKRARSIAGQQSARINLVYSRAIRKFKGDEQLYLHYARHCIDAGSKKAADKVLARAIAHRGDSERVWLAAIGFHFDSCGDAKVARALAQRALRALKTSKVLWKEYFRLELIYLAKLIARRVAIGVDVPGRSGDSAQKSQAVESVDSSTRDLVQDTEVPEKVSAAQFGFWEGGVPLAVLRRARDAACLSREDAYGYYEIATMIKLTPRELIAELQLFIEEGFTDSSAQLVGFIKLRGCYDVASAALRKQRAINLAATTAEKEQSCDEGEKFRLTADGKGLRMFSADSEAENVAAANLAARFVVSDLERGHNMALRDYCCLQEPIRHFMNCLREDLEDTVVDVLCARCESVLLAIGQRHSEVDEIVGLASLADVSAKNCPRAWARFLSSFGVQALEADDKASLDEIRAHLKRNAAILFRSQGQEAICIAWLEWERDVDCLRTAYNLLLGLPPLAGSILVAAINAELRVLSLRKGCTHDASITFERIRLLYKKGVSIPSLTSDVEFWLRYVCFERDLVKNASNAAAVQWKARRILSTEMVTVFDERVMLLNVA